PAIGGGRRTVRLLRLHTSLKPRAQVTSCPTPDPSCRRRRLVMTFKILDPTVPPEPTESSLAKRESGLDGKVLGLLDNSKVNGDRLLDLVRLELGARYDLREVVVMTKAGASTVADDAMLDALASRCDVVVTAIGY